MIPYGGGIKDRPRERMGPAIEAPAMEKMKTIPDILLYHFVLCVAFTSPLHPSSIVVNWCIPFSVLVHV